MCLYLMILLDASTSLAVTFPMADSNVADFAVVFKT